MPLYSQSRRFQGVAQCLLPSRYRLRACECEVLTYRQIAAYLNGLWLKLGAASERPAGVPLTARLN